MSAEAILLPAEHVGGVHGFIDYPCNRDAKFPGRDDVELGERGKGGDGSGDNERDDSHRADVAHGQAGKNEDSAGE